MSGAKLSLVVACSRNGVIGKENGLPWRLPNDLRRFRAITYGHPVIMGRKTFESIGRPLPGRENIVISRNPSFASEGVRVVRSLEDAIEPFAGRDQELFVIGGAEIYRLALASAWRIYLTSIEADVEGDAYFPDWESKKFRLVSDEPHPADDQHAFAFRFKVLERQ